MKKPEEFADFPLAILNDPRWRNATWRYRGVIKDHTDGDTSWFYVDMGYRRYAFEAMRYIGYDAWERYRGTAEERQKGAEATAYLEALLPVKDGLQQGTKAGLVTEKEDETLSRWAAQVLVVFTEQHVPILQALQQTPTYFRSEDTTPPNYERYIGAVIDVADFFRGTEHEKVISSS